MTLALLLTAVTGAWADEEPQLLTTITFDANGPVYSESGIVTLSSTGSGITSAGIYFIAPISPTETMVATVDVATGKDVSKVVFYGYDGDDFVYPLEDTEAPYVCYANAEGRVRSLSSDLSNSVGAHRIGKIEVYGHAEPAIDVTPVTGKTNEWTFTMPAFDVEIAPIYAPTAQWAKVENVDQLPTAIEGIYAESTDAIVKAGTVAKIGETENPQGIVMYAVTSTNQATAPALSAFSADVPTAKDIKVGSDVLVWYYIKGADTPEGEEATAENTFNDSEICATPITVTVIPINYDIQFKAANDNTIQAGKATVKVGETAARVDNDGNLTSVKMNSKVTVTAKEGYKFRKVEATHQGWQRKGLGTITDGFFTSLFNKPDITVHCNVYENVNTPGLYKIDGFQCALVAAYFGISEEEMKRYENGNWKNVKILIDATNTEKVSISAQQYGVLVNPDYGFIRIQSEATGKLVDNAITFPSRAVYVGFEGLGRWYYGNVNGTFKIMLPK